MTRTDDRQSVSTLRPFAFLLVAYAFLVNMLGTTLPTPLYSIYQQHLGFSELMITVIFAMYAFGVITALIVVGGWSDEVGRKRMLLSGLALSAASAVVFLIGGSLAPLLIGRVLSGLSAGIFTGTATVAVVELAPSRLRSLATLIATAANMGGLGCGPLFAGLLAQYAPLPVHLCFIADLGLLALAAVAVIYSPETVNVSPEPRLRPQRLTIPASVRGVFVPAAIGGFAGFAVLGMFTGVAPAFLGKVLNLSNHAITGAVVFLLFAASTVGQLSLQKVPERWALPGGCLLLACGASLVGIAIGNASLGLLIAGAAVAGFGQGLGFRAGMAAITAASPETHRGAVASTYFVVLYVAISIPVVGIGIVDRLEGLRIAGIAFAAVVTALAISALIALAMRSRRRTARQRSGSASE